jgi:hypothetical protein
MPSLTCAQLTDIFGGHIQEEFRFFVETGTFLGDTVRAMAPIFECVVSIEVDQERQKANMSNPATNLPNVHLYTGDSVVVLPDVIKDVDGPAVFFLDGHYSGPNTGRGQKDCPLIEELEVIKTRKFFDLIIIDDYRLFQTRGLEDWSEISEEAIRRVLGGKMESMFVLNDRLCIFTRGIHEGD